MAMILLSGCVTETTSGTSTATTASDTNISSTQKKLVEAANWAKGRTTLVVNGKKYNTDCSGVVSAIYKKAGIDINKEYGKYKGGGVQRLHQILRDKGLLYNTKLPQPGDLLFWDNTYDANNNHKADDGLTHIGMVVSSNKKTGETVYVHHHYKKGIVFETMNLYHPDDPKYNAAMREKGLPKVGGKKYLASQLLRDSGKAYLLK